jgi:hypothetical protein
LFESQNGFTVEGLQQGDQVHPIQQAFKGTGAIQCCFCTPAQILTAKALLDENPNPSEMDVRNALSGVYCRCTGYVKIIEAVMRAAAIMRGEKVEPVGYVDLTLPEDASKLKLPPEFYSKSGTHKPLAPGGGYTTSMKRLNVVGKYRKPKWMLKKLVSGKPAYHKMMLIFPDSMAHC